MEDMTIYFAALFAYTALAVVARILIQEEDNAELYEHYGITTRYARYFGWMRRFFNSKTK